MAAVNPYQSPAGPGPGPGPAGQGSAQSTGLNEGDGVSVSWPNPSSRARPAGDLFQPEREQGGERVSVPAPAPGYAWGARWWVGRGDGLAFGVPGAVIALAASVALVLVLAGVTVFTTSLSRGSAVVGPTQGRLPAPVTPVISDGHPAIAPSVDAPARPAEQTPAEASSPDPSPVAARQQQFVPAGHRAVSAPPAHTPPASDQGPVVPPPSSTVATDDARSRIVTADSNMENTESRTTNTEPCNCDDTMRKAPTHGDRKPKADHHRGPRAQQADCRQRALPEDQGSASEERRDRTARPDAATEPRPSPGQPKCPGPGSTPSPTPNND
jgi:hypothetical protein